MERIRRSSPGPRRRRLAALAGAVATVGSALLLAGTGAVFTGATTSPGTLTAADLAPLVPASVTATRTDAATCTVSWTPSAAAQASGAPAPLRYEVSDGTTVLATGVAGTTAVISTAADVTPRVSARVGPWSSATWTAAAAGCGSVPGPPLAVATDPAEGRVAVTWAPPGTDGRSPVTRYTVTASPADATLPPRSCSTTAVPPSTPATTCTVSGLTDGVLHTVTVTARNTWGDGAASAAVTTTPYPSTVMSGPSLRMWLDADEPSTVLTGPGGTEQAAAGQGVTRWRDRSGGGADAVLPATAGAPQLTAGALGGRRALRFDRTVPQYLDVTRAGVGAVGSGPRTILVAGVARTTAGGATNANGAFVAWPGLHTGLFAEGAPTAARYFHGSFTSTHVYSYAQLPRTGPAVLTGTVEVGAGGIVTSLSVDGVRTTAPARTGSPRSYADVIRIGAANGPAQGADNYNWYLDGDIGEVLLFDRTVSPAEQRTLEEYLARKWSRTLPPSAPSSVSVAPGDRQAGVTWAAPPWDGGSAVTGYTVTAVPADTSLPSRACGTVPPATTCTLTELVNGVGYAVTVTAANAVGTGPASAGTEAVPVPSVLSSASTRVWLDAQRTGSTTTDTAGTAPAAAGDPVRRWRSRAAGDWDAVRPGVGAAPVLTAAALNGRPAVRFDRTRPDILEVTAPGIGAVGSADRSMFVVARGRTTKNAAPDPYGSLAVWPDPHSGIEIAGHPTADAFIAPTWTAGRSQHPRVDVPVTGPFLGSHVAASGGGSVSSSASVAGAPLATATRPGGWYDHRALDVLRIGGGFATDVDNAHLLDGDIGELIVLDRAVTAAERRTVEEYLARRWGLPVTPAAPSAPVPVAGEQQLAVTWTAPAWDGGSAVTATTATAVPADTSLPTRSCTAAAPSTGCTVTGLTNGVTYTVTAAASNALGAGPASGAVTGIPYPASVMTAARTALWLDGADASTMTQDGTGTTPASAVGDPVGRWRDKSGRGNHAVQVVAGQRARLAPDPATGRLVPRFDNGDDRYDLDVTKMPTGTTPSTHFLLAARDADPPSGYAEPLLWGSDGATGTARSHYLELATSQMCANPYGTTPTACHAMPAVGANHVLGAGFAPTGTSVFLDGGPAAVAAGVVPATGTEVAYLGAYGVTWPGTISEVVLLAGAVTEAERRAVEEYLGRKWGVPVTPSAPSSVSAAPGERSAAVTWTAPVWNGGAAVLDTTATATPRGTGTALSCTTGGTGCTITGLTNGVTYDVTVRSRNAVGQGAVSTATTALPYPATVMTAGRLALWLDGADGSTLLQDAAGGVPASAAGHPVGRWRDKSGRGNDAVQAVAGRRALLAPDPASGHLVPRFDNGDDRYDLDVTKMPTGTTPSTHFLLAARDANPPSGYAEPFYWGGNGVNGRGRSHYLETGTSRMCANVYGTNPTACLPMPAIGPGRILGAAYTASSVAVFHDGGTPVVVNGTVSTSADVAYLGAYGVTWPGTISEVVLFADTLTAAERRSVEEYLARKWGTTLAP